jgi:hypothetical protein
LARKQVGASAEKDKIGIVQLNTEPATPVTKTKNVLVGNVLLASLVVDAKPKFVKVDEVDEEDDTDDSKVNMMFATSGKKATIFKDDDEIKIDDVYKLERKKTF